jgi:hypothetical protein
MAQVTLLWTTDVPATSWVEYGTTTSYGSDSGLVDPVLTTSHSVTLTGLAASTLYHFRIHSRNASGAETITLDSTFSTGPTLVGSQPNATGAITYVHSIQ